MSYRHSSHEGAFDRLVTDLIALDERRSRDRRARDRLTAYRQQQPALTKSYETADFSAIRADQARLQRQLDRDHAATTRRQCAATLAQLDQAAKAGRLTGLQGAKLDQLRSRFGAMTATPFSPPIRPNPPRAA